MKQDELSSPLHDEQGQAQAPAIEDKISAKCQQLKQEYDEAAAREFQLMKQAEQNKQQLETINLEQAQVEEHRKKLAYQLDALQNITA